MAVNLSTAVRNARLDVIETTIGTGAILEVRSGTKPANCAAADSGTLLASITCPSDWLAAASGGAKALLGTWNDLSADASGTAGHFRVKDSGLVACHMQGSITATGGGGDMTLSSTTLVAAQAFAVTTFTLTDGNA